ncbi:MAG: twin-arginine translocase TatA/TatE family subunit [Planctomycetota bacterium]
MTHSLAIFSGLGPVEFVALVILGILLYGKNLPTVARTLGRTIGEFKRQMREVEDSVRRQAFQEELKQAREVEERKDREKREREEKERAAAPAVEAAPAQLPPASESGAVPPVAGQAGPPAPMPKG